MQNLKNYFLCNHRLNRKPFLFIMLAIILVASIIVFNLSKEALTPEHQQALIALMQANASGKITPAEYTQQLQTLTTQMATDMPMARIFIISFIASLLLLPAQVMRLKDLDYSPWLVVVMFASYLHVPFLIMVTLAVPVCILGLLLLFKRGTKGPNRYGPDPLETKAAV